MSGRVGKGRKLSLPADRKVDLSPMARKIIGERFKGEAVPPDEVAEARLRQGPLAVEDTYVGQSLRRVVRGIDVIDLLQRNGTINTDMAAAARRFRSEFHRAALDPLRTADLSRIPGGGYDIPLHVLEARRTLHQAITALGGLHSPCAMAAWWIIGAGTSIVQWASSNHAGQLGKFDRYVAKGILVGALSVLVEFYRLRRKANKNNAN